MKSQRIKVLHLITRLIVGGAQDNTLLTVEKHNRDRYEVHLASNPDAPWHNRAKHVADQFHALPALENPLNPIQDIQALSQILSLLRRERFDIVHTHSSKAGILGRIAARLMGNCMVVHTIHGFAFHDFMPTWKQQYYILLERAVRSCTDFFITVCEQNRKQALALGLLREKQSQAIYSGIDFTRLDQPCNIQKIRHQFSIPDGWQVIGMVGRLDTQKAPHFLIEAFEKVSQVQPKTLLFLVGEGELRAQLEAQAAQLGLAKTVKFLGSRNDVPDILKVIDIFALSSLWEGLGRAMTEAMLIGKPVVVPDIYGIPEIVHHQKTGLLFPVGDVSTLSQHLIDLLQNSEKRDHLGKAAKKLTRELFSADKMTNEIEEIYDILLKRMV